MSARKFNQIKSIHPSARQMSLRLRPVCHAIALMLAAGAAVNAQAGANLANVGAQISAARSAATGGGVNLGVGVSPQQALQASQPSIQNLAHAAQGIAQQIAAQQAAAVAGLTTASTVPNGLAVGGLQVAQGITFVKDGNGNPVSQNTDDTNPLLWVNAYGPTQKPNANGGVTVNVQQTAQNAVVTWQTMNVGKQTTLNFDQSAGTQSNGANNWVILNRIMDPSGTPSQILGNVTAQGSVYVINRNGILFGAGSQVNVHSLAASSLDFLSMNDALTQAGTDIAASNHQFLTSGSLLQEATGASGQTAYYEVLGLGGVADDTSGQYQTPGNITIEPGASITTQTNGTVSNGGFVLIAAPNVTNGGTITATNGQIILAAGIGLSVTGKSEIMTPVLSGQLQVDSNGTEVDVTPAGTLTNTGLIQADKGTINLLGSNVVQNGVVGVTTGVSFPGAITISTVDEAIALNPAGAQYNGLSSDVPSLPIERRAGSLTFGPGSVTADLPEEDGETTTSDPTVTFTPGSITLTAGSVWFQSGSLIEAPGSTVSVAALATAAPPDDTGVQGRIYLDTGATIDVSGLANVELPIADELITVPLIGQNELANSPLLRDGFLDGLKNVVFDSTLSGTNPDGSQWVGSPILNLSGYVSLIPRSIDQLLTNGGTITLAGSEVMTADGSSLNLNGGYIHYLGGVVDTTRLVDANGAIVPIGQASPYDTFVGIAGEFVESHPRWGVTNDWFNPLLSGGAYEGDFIVGGNAGTLNVFASDALVLDGGITAQAFNGEKQTQDDAQPVGGTFALGVGATLTAFNGQPTGFSGEPGAVVLQNTAPQLSDVSPGFNADTPLDTAALNALGANNPNNIAAVQTIPVDTLNAGGFANVSVTEDGTTGKGITVAAGTQLTVQPGGSITLSAPSTTPINILGSLVAPDGTISVALHGSFGDNNNIEVGPDATISVAGQWVNDDSQAAPGTQLEGSEYINGGSITLSVDSGSTEPLGGTSIADIVDASGSIILDAGSVLDVSSGGYLQSNGQLLSKNGIPEGTAGSLSLLTYVGGFSGTDGHASLPGTPPTTSGRIEMDGTIRSLGFAGGGTLTLQGLGFQIGGDPASASSADLYLPADFFANQGFGSYVLNAMYSADVAPGTTVRLTQQNLIPDIPALQQADTGSDIEGSGLTSAGTLDPFHRQATNLVMTGGGWLGWTVPTGTIPAAYVALPGDVTLGAGASIVADAGASVGLGSATQVTVLGSIIAPGGSITLSGDTAGDFALPGQWTRSNGATTPSQSVWLGSDAVLDVAGVALENPLTAPVRVGSGLSVPDTGEVLPGGTVVLSDDRGYVVAQAGSVIDVSGASANFDEPQSNGSYASQPVWSDAGAITLAANSGLYFNGTIKAQGGAAQAQGGTLTIVPEQGAITSTLPDGTVGQTSGATLLVVQQAPTAAPSAAAPGDSFGGSSTGVIEFSADTLDGSGISTLVLGAQLGSPGEGNVQPVPIAFAGNVNLSLANSVIVNAPEVVALGAGQLSQLLSSPGTTPVTLTALLAEGPGDVGAPTVTINAPYVAFVGPQTSTSNSPIPSPTVTANALADGTLDVNASFIDLENQIALGNFVQSTFTSSGDIRLSSTDLNGSVLEPGDLFTPGNLTFKGADLYPATGSTFILDAVAPAGAPATTITFLSNGPSDVPLSAGGTLLVDATDIVQAGTVRAPSGSLIFGVGDTTDPATIAQFNNLPLTDTQEVTLANGSVTSVSDGGTVIPYGTTLDGTEWQFDPSSNTATPDVTAPPQKFISVNGSSVALNAGATIDLSGGGDLQAEEWVPGTGGTRDVLSQYNVSFATNPTGTAVPLNIGGANVYAIVPSYHAPAAAYDPVFAQVAQPGTNANGSATTASIGVGQAGVTDKVGESVYLSGVPGLPAGYYTLLPAKYATLPGAFRVTVSSASGPVIPGSNGTLPDGTDVVAGYMGNALDGSRSAIPTLFDVQSGAVWQQYSQYTLTSANSFFPALAANAGNVAPQLPMDAGHLVIAATTGLSLDTTLNAAPAAGGAPAEVDIASQDIQIVGNGETALPGYLQISADQLDALGAGSLLLGGTRTQTTGGLTIDAIANSVVVSNDAADPLSGPEIMLVTKTDPTNTDPNAANGLRIDSGSVITASGSYPAAKDVPITIGQNADSTTGALAISGDGAFLSVTDGADAVVTRVNTSPADTNAGLLTVGAGAVLSGGAALTLDSSGNLTFDPAASLSGNVIAVDASAITFTDQTGAGAAALAGFVAGPSQIAQLANAEQVILRSAGTMYFDGTLNLNFGNNVDLSAGTYSSDGGSVTINAPQVAFTNEVGAPPAGTITTGPGTLTINAQEIDFGAGDTTLSGFGSVTMNATGGIAGQGTGKFDFGAVPVTLNAPVFLADTNSDTTIQTTGTLNLNPAAGTALTRTALGGALSFIGGTVNDNGATIEAPAGNVSLEATTGDLTIGNGSLLNAGGVALPFFDVMEYAPAGAITLTADIGTVNVQAGATLDFAGAQGGGAAGSLSLSAPDQVVNLAGTIEGAAASGYLGGSFSLDMGGAANLDSLAAELAAGGVNDAIVIRTNAGNLALSAGNTLTAHMVSLTADGGAGGQDSNNGNVQIDGTINAAGNAGGEIDLYGKSSVNLQGSLIATGSSATEQGGTVNIGTSAVFDPNAANPYNPTYGYENVDLQDSGAIVLGSGALINVSGGTAGGLSNGTVNIRVPLLADGTVNLTVEPFEPNKGVVGSRATTLEAYAVWSTTDGTTGNQHFDGIVDPAGWYQVAGPNSTPQLVGGTFTDQSGNNITYTPGTYDTANGTWTTATLSNDPGASWAKIQTDLANDLANDFFTPNAGDANTAHQQFYGYESTTTNSDGSVTTTPGTLMKFVQTFDVAATAANGLANLVNANLVIAPGIELDNPSTAINKGNISILTNWNLGAGTSETDLAFRVGGLASGQAPIITFRAENNVNVDASLTDGFFQIANPTGGSIPVPPLVPYMTAYNAAEAAYTAPQGYLGYSLQKWSQFYGLNAGPGKLTDPILADALTDATGKQEVEQYYALYTAYQDFLLAPVLPSILPGFLHAFRSANSAATNIDVIADLMGFGSFLPGQLSGPSIAYPSNMAQAATPAEYLFYLQSYESYFTQTALLIGNQIPTIVAPQAPAEQPDAVIAGATISPPAATDNSPSPIPTAADPLPLLSASLNSGNSSTFRLVAGANTSSSNPLAVQAAAMFSGSQQGSVTLDRNFAVVDSDGKTLLAPTMIRTGTGAIDIAAGNDVAMLDASAPGVIYTGGAPDANAPASNGAASVLVSGNAGAFDPDILVTPTVNPESGGDISISAQNDITGIENVTDDTAGSVTGIPGKNLSQFWWQWLETGNVANPSGQVTQTSINFGAFDQGVMSVGGNVSVSAGGNITDLAVSLPTTWYLTSPTTVATVGGGNLTVSARGNILSGDYFVANGTGTIAAGERIGADGSTYTQFNLNSQNNQGVGPVSTLLATQNGAFDVTARQGVDIGGVFDPSYIEGRIQDYGLQADSQGYSSASSISIVSTTGNVALGSLGETSVNPGVSALTLLGINDGEPAQFAVAETLPATVNAVALSGGITVSVPGELYPSLTGELTLIANGSIVLSTGDASSGSEQVLGMIDVDPLTMPSPTDPIDENAASGPGSGYLNALADNSTSGLHDASVLHANDAQPVRIYSLNGSIVDGSINDAGQYTDLVSLNPDKPALIYAGDDIINLAFIGQNLSADDVTRIVAGHDIDDAPVTSLAINASKAIPGLQLAGPGTFDIEAGGNLGPLTNEVQDPGATTGILAIGNADNSFLPHESANVQVLFGVGPGIDDQAFISAYVNPASTIAGVPSTTPALIAFMEQYDAGQGVDTGLAADKTAAQAKVGTLTADQAWAQFQALPSYVQQMFAQQVLFNVLTDVGNDFNNPQSPFFQQYSRGYQAINTLFPASLGYTANDLSGGVNGANQLVTTGNLDIRSTTIQTQQGGNVSILGPGGQALIGSASAPAEVTNSSGEVVAGPNTMGILTLEQGNVDIFTDQSLLLAQSRIFTEQGGDMTIWSSNGDINAGKGSKSVADVPPPEYVCDANHYCTLDVKGEVTGAGIATLQTIPGAQPGDINLIAPRGTVDAGDAGIRVSGNLNVAALHVLNADNIQVQGKATGIPVVAAVDTGALTAGSAAASAATQMAQNLVRNNASGVQQRHWIITVQVEGFGDSNSNDDESPKKRKPATLGYDSSSAVSILGFGKAGDTQKAVLSKEEQSRLGKI
jgi:filamentous hemagglutinin family protein